MRSCIGQSDSIITGGTSTDQATQQVFGQLPRILELLLLSIFLGCSVLSSVISPEKGIARTLKAAQTAGTKSFQRRKPMPSTIAKSFGKLPVRFEANRGQTFSDVDFLSRGRGYTLFLTSSEAVLSLDRGSSQSSKDRRPSVGLPMNSLLPEGVVFTPLSLFSEIENLGSHAESEPNAANTPASAQGELHE